MKIFYCLKISDVLKDIVSVPEIYEFYQKEDIAIIENFGGSIINADDVCHGKVYTMKHFSNCILFNDIHHSFNATRYHSLVSDQVIPDCLEITAISKNNNEIMGVQHKKYQIFGLQFHPESIETKNGMTMIKNFINGIR